MTKETTEAVAPKTQSVVAVPHVALVAVVIVVVVALNNYVGQYYRKWLCSEFCIIYYVKHLLVFEI